MTKKTVKTEESDLDEKLKSFDEGESEGVEDDTEENTGPEKIDNPYEGGVLYIVATPIGNIEDITYRAIKVLKSVDVIFCEDTRQSAKLFSYYQISKRTESYHAQSGTGRIEHIINILRGGQSVAYVTDSGTPGISDPSSLLVSSVRERLPDTPIVAIPGPSALTAAVSIAGLPIDEFIFSGFLPHKKGRETLLKEIANSKRACIFYESTHRIEKALAKLAEYMTEEGESHQGKVRVGVERPILIAREITKMFEEAILLTPSDHLSRMKSDTNKTRGEFVVIVPGLR